MTNVGPLPLPLPFRSSTEAFAPAEAAVVLHQAAATRAGADTAARPGQWISVESTVRGIPGHGVRWAPGENAGTPRPSTTFRIRSWYPATGGTFRGCKPAGDHRDGCTVDLGRVVRQVNGREETVAQLPGRHGWDPGNENFVRSLPTDPALLRARIYAQADQKSFLRDFDRDQTAVQTIADLMRPHPARPARRPVRRPRPRPGGAPDTDAVGNAGRHGVGFTRTGQGERLQIIVARGSYRYLGDRLTSCGTT
ncbi:hypothetical protein [Actinomadura geliboluensis]